MNSSIIDEDIVHFEIGIFARFGIVKFYKGVLEGVACLSVTNDLATVEKKVLVKPLLSKI